MTKKVFSKAIAVVLVAAMCMVAVFTGAVSASQAATCTLTGYGYDAGSKDSYVKADVTFASSAAFTAGSFGVTAEGLSLVDCTVKEKVVAGATDFEPNIYLNVSGKKILFAGFDEDDQDTIGAYSSLTLELSFTVNNPKSLDAASAGTTWPITITNPDITNMAEETYVVSTTVACPVHVHAYTYTGSGNAEVATCDVAGCNEQHTQVTNTGALEPNTLVSDGIAANVTFTNNGDTVLNALLPTTKYAESDYDEVYFVYHYIVNDDSGNNETLEGVSTATVQSLSLPGQAATSYYVFPCGRNAGIGRLHYDVTGNFVTVKNGEYTISDDWTYSIKAYAEALVASGTTTQKNYSKALINYGYNTLYMLDDAAAAAVYGTQPYGLIGVSMSQFATGTSTATISGTDANWGVSKISVTTGYKPKMNIKFNNATFTGSGKTITITVKNTSNKVVYYKEIDPSLFVNNTFVLSDIPVKYLEWDIIIGEKTGSTESAKTITYSYMRYACARMQGGKDDADVFISLMDWIKCLNAEFGYN